MWAATLHEGELPRAAAEESLWRCLNADVHSGKLVPLSALSLTPHEFPVGEALRRAVVLPESLRPMLEQAGIELVLVEPGNGPNFWSIENAARDIGEIEGWSKRQVETLCEQMLDAAKSSALVVRHPHTELPVPPKGRPAVRTFYELVSRDDVNVWLVGVRAPFRWLTYDQAAAQPRYIAGRRLWKLSEAIEVIAAMPGFGVSATALRERVQGDAEKEKITLRDLAHGAEIRSDWGAIVLGWCLYAEDFNAWLEAAGYPEPYRLPTVDAVTSPVMSGAPGPSLGGKAELPDDPMQKRGRLLEWFREEGGKRPTEGGKRGKRGALTQVVRRAGIDKDTLGAMLDKAIDEKRRADAYAQLTAKR